nr:MAG TPA: hypothetical protein [Caudoviricetes sp.]
MAKTKELMYICTNNNNSIIESMFQRLNKIFSNEYIINKLSTRKIANFARRKNINATFICIDSIGNGDNSRLFDMLGNYYKNIDNSGIKLYFLSIDDINKPSKEDKYCNKIKHWLDVRNQEMNRCLKK